MANVTRASTILPALLVFSLDELLWPIAEFVVPFPCELKNGSIIDSAGRVIPCFPQVPEIFERIKRTDMKIAIIECVASVKNTTDLIKLFGWDKYASFIELDEKSNNNYHDIIKRLHEKSKIPYNKMILFYNRDVYFKLDPIKEMGVFTKYAYHEGSMTMTVLDDALQEYNLLRQPKDKQK